MPDNFSIEELAQRVNAWCKKNGIEPASDQAGAEVNERNIRYYRTIGLLDAPAGGIRGYGEKHLLQLMAVRLLQAQGLPLRRIRELLYGRSLDELREVRERGLAEARTTLAATRVMMPAGDELWRVTPLDNDFLIVSRSGRTLDPGQRAAVARALAGFSPSTKTKSHPQK